jgi:Family of unknown function (DUF5995)
MPDTYDARIAAIATSRPLHSIADVVAIMQALDGELSRDDGLKWFNLLYLRVTESVGEEPSSAGWNDQRWLERLDVVFAGLYFGALASWAQHRKATPRCWRALLDARWRTDVARIQFALAGMNAHINHDLSIALLRTSEERNDMPDLGSPQHRDYERVNGLLERVEGEVKGLLLSPIAGELDRHFGRVDDVIALWKVRKARETAWVNGELLWQLRQISLASRKFLQNLDRLVGLSGKGLLVPTQIG